MDIDIASAITSYIPDEYEDVVFGAEYTPKDYYVNGEALVSNGFIKCATLAIFLQGLFAYIQALHANPDLTGPNRSKETLNYIHNEIIPQLDFDKNEEGQFVFFCRPSTDPQTLYQHIMRIRHKPT